jgi:hypothetical protein
MSNLQKIIIVSMGMSVICFAGLFISSPDGKIMLPYNDFDWFSQQQGMTWPEVEAIREQARAQAKKDFHMLIKKYYFEIPVKAVKEIFRFVSPVYMIIDHFSVENRIRNMTVEDIMLLGMETQLEFEKYRY